MSRVRPLMRRLEAEAAKPSLATAPPPPAKFRRFQYTLPEWNHFVLTRNTLRARGLEAALAWMRDHPRPPHVPAWVLEKEARSRRDFVSEQGLPDIPDLVPDDLPDGPED